MTYLQEVIDVAGVVDPDLPTLFHFSDGAMYESGHGRGKCKPEMCVKPGEPEEAIPVNCGYHQDWISPKDFTQCGLECRGAFCSCVSSYPMNQYCDYYDFDLETGQVMMMKEM